MSNVPPRETFENAYKTEAPWDIGGPQKPFIAAADKITGNVLDAGCGLGDMALYFAQCGRKVTGIDFLAEPIERAKRKAAEQKVQATFLVHDAMALETLQQSFDNVVDSGLFHVFDDDACRKYVAALGKVLKPGGRLFLMCFSDAEPPSVGPRRISQAELRGAFSDGWNVESIEPAVFGLNPRMKDLPFSPGGPKAWFATIARK